jgi:hypothetical protein
MARSYCIAGMDHTAVAMPAQRIEAPNPPELEWVAGYVDMAERLAAARLGTTGPPDVDALDALWAAWLSTSPPAKEADDMVHAVGLAFGQRLVDELEMRWMVVTDDYGTEMAAHEPRGNMLVFPANLVAKRWDSRQTGFLRPIYDDAAAKLAQLRLGP